MYLEHWESTDYKRNQKVSLNVIVTATIESCEKNVTETASL